MGGVGSGNRLQSGKAKTEDYKQIDVRLLARKGLLEPLQSFTCSWSRNDEVFAQIGIRVEEGLIRMKYCYRKQGGDWVDMNYPVFLDETQCHLRGKRQWFLCPNHGCGKRVAILYGGSVFACRHCRQLAYPSQREPLHDRAMRRAEYIRGRLGWPAGTDNGHWDKPKGMHWRTYERLCAQHDQYEEAGWAALLARYGKFID